MGASVSYGGAGVYARHAVKGVAPLPSAFLEVGFAFLIMLVLAFGFERPLATQMNWESLLAVGWLGLVGSGLAFLAFFFLLGRWGATRTSTVAYLLPVVAVILGVLVRQEPVTLPILAGMALIIGGVALANSRYGQRRLFGRREIPSEPVVPAGD
jgi:drug/metabolite transporter (DMT)-like permease